MKKTIRLTERELRNMISESVKRVLTEVFDPDMPVVVVGGDLQGEYTAQEIIDDFETGEAVNSSSRISGYPKLHGYLGPMWDGDRIRYESPDAYNTLSM